jgi:hypothetical protein
MKGVIAQIAPSAEVIDLTHNIPPGDVHRGAFVLWQSRAYFPPDTIFLAVVDPGVGTQRKGMILQANNQLFIGPDNGLFTFVFGQDWQAWTLENPAFRLPTVSHTFHGRDIFAPAAAYATQGVTGPEFGPALLSPNKLPEPLLDSPNPHTICGEILHSDRFGNLITSLGCFHRRANHHLELTPWVGSLPTQMINLTEWQLLLPDGRHLDWVSTFAELDPGKCGMLVGSTGLIEIIANQTSAADLLGLNPGEIITLSKFIS